ERDVLVHRLGAALMSAAAMTESHAHRKRLYPKANPKERNESIRQRDQQRAARVTDLRSEHCLLALECILNKYRNTALGDRYAQCLVRCKVFELSLTVC